MNEEKEPMKHYECTCGKSEHYADAAYCTNCGKKIEEAAVTTSSDNQDL